MRHLIFSTMPVSKPSSSSPANSNPSSVVLCKHSPSAAATLDLLILLLVLFSGSFLVTSYLAYIFNSLSLLSLHLRLPHVHLPAIAIALLLLAAAALLFFSAAGASRSRRCHRPGCRGLAKAMEFDLKLQSEDSLRDGLGGDLIDRLPWKGGSEANPDYDCLRSELRKMAPPNGRAVLLFRARCGCPVAKLEGWGPKRGRRHKKS